jgi:hypothetical protein
MCQIFILNGSPVYALPWVYRIPASNNNHNSHIHVVFATWQMLNTSEAIFHLISSDTREVVTNTLYFTAEDKRLREVKWHAQVPLARDS